MFEAVGDVLGPERSPLLRAERLRRHGPAHRRAPQARACPAGAAGGDGAGRRRAADDVVDRVIASSLASALRPACISSRPRPTPSSRRTTSSADAALRSHEEKTAPHSGDRRHHARAALSDFAAAAARDWPFLLVKSGSKYFTKGKSTLGVVACAEEPLAAQIVARARCSAAMPIRSRSPRSWPAARGAR